TDAHAGAGRDARVGQLLTGNGGLGAQRRVAQWGFGGAVALERGRSGAGPAALLAGQGALDPEVAFPQAGPRGQQVAARSGGGGGVVGREGRLLPDDRGEVAVEDEHELFHLPPLRIARRAVLKAPRVDEAERRNVLVEHEGVVKAKDGIDAAVMQEAEATYLG